jgi:type VI secretion system protein VasG
VQQQAELEQGGEVPLADTGAKDGERSLRCRTRWINSPRRHRPRPRRKIDPVFGRDNEIRQMVDILSRRRKNNPILVGEPGVGKTALVEGLALRIAEGNVPNPQPVIVRTLDLGLFRRARV